jgi:hypothetical protein
MRLLYVLSMQTHAWRRLRGIRRPVADRGTSLLSAAVIIVLPTLFGCAASSSPSTENNEGSPYGYPTQSLGDFFKGSGTPSQTADCRTEPAPQPHVPGYPNQSLVDYFTNARNSQAPDPPQPHVPGYPNQSLVDYFTNARNSQAPVDCVTQSRTADVPRPPSTYTASGQPYSPPAGSAAYPPAPPATATASSPPQTPPPSAAASSPPPPSNTASVYPQESLIDFFKRTTSR